MTELRIGLITSRYRVSHPQIRHDPEMAERVKKFLAEKQKEDRDRMWARFAEELDGLLS